MRNRDLRAVSILAALTLFGYSACAAGSSKDEPYPGFTTGGSGGTKSTGGPKSSGDASAPDSSADGGEPNTPPKSPGLDFGGAPSSDDGDGGTEACASLESKAELLPLALYIMLDSSGSMANEAPEGGSKWDAVKSALSAFITDKASSDISVGLQYFPLDKPNVPEVCTSNAECGAAGPCFLKWCWNYPLPVPCESDLDCDIFGPCVKIASCSASPADSPIACGVPGQACSGELGMCEPLAESFCVHPATCAVSAYATPAVPIAPLSENASDLLASLDQEIPDGMYTTTGPAIRGAIQHAQDYAKDHPGHSVAVVLATDGLPTAGECQPDDIASIATIVAQGRHAKPSVRTFVIGIFGQNDAGAFDNLTAIATAGGHTAFLVDSDADDVTLAFSEALREIRGAALTCEYKLPPAPDGDTLDYNLVNVKARRDTKSVRLRYVGKESACDDEGGWYYDVNPSAGIPTRIALCQASCEGLQGSVDSSVSIEVGCTTVVK